MKLKKREGREGGGTLSPPLEVVMSLYALNCHQDHDCMKESAKSNDNRIRICINSYFKKKI